MFIYVDGNPWLNLVEDTGGNRLTNGVYFDGTNYNDICVPVKGNLRFEFPK
jgi:hypothetical protein